MLDQFLSLMQRGGWVMWPLTGLSVIAVMLSFERLWFFVHTNHPRRQAWVIQISGLIQTGQWQQAQELAKIDSSVYGLMLHRLLNEAIRPTDAIAVAAINEQHSRLERFMSVLSTIITAAPMLGILGTVLGIISSFEVLAEQTAATDPRSVSQGIAEALITTALGLMISLLTLFPYNGYRGQIDRTISRLEALAGIVVGSESKVKADLLSAPLHFEQTDSQN